MSTTQNKTTWRTVRLGDVSSLITKGTTPTTIGGKFVSSGINFIKAESISDDGNFIGNKFGHIDEETNELLRRSIVCENDILYSIAGVIGRSARVTKDILPANTNQALAIVRPNQKVVNPKYLFYALSAPKQRRLANSLIAQSVQANINLRQVSDFEVVLPGINEQGYIAEILSAFDEKIENNNRIIKTLEEMVQTTFKERFDISPATLPKGWVVKNVLEIVKRIPVGKKYENKTALPVGKVSILDQGQSGYIGFHNDEPGVMASIDEPVIVFTNHTCYYRLITYPFSAIQNVLPYVGANGYSTLFAYYLTKDKIKMQEYKGHWPEFEQQEFVVPPTVLAEEFSSLIKPMVQKIVESENENQKLATMRDLLLPRLMSGELSAN